MEPSEIEAYEKLTTRVPAKELSTLLKVSSTLASTMDLTQVLQIAIESAVELLGLETGAIYTLESETLHLGATVPPLAPEMPAELLHAHLADHPHIKQAVSTKTPVYLADAQIESLSAAEKLIIEQRGLISILYFPLLLKENAIGVFILATTDKVRQFTGSEIDLSYILSFQVSLAIANAQLYKKAQDAIINLTKAYDATLQGWSRMLDMRDHATDEHTQRVADLTVALATRMGIPEAELAHIRRGALLHDIGKMGIPDAILQRPAILSEAEWPIMRTHPEKAYQVLSQIEFLGPALDIPYCHHERWDGTGYPRKLKGEEIPMAARLFAVVDVFDALTSDRPYRKAWSEEKALAYLQEQSGKSFFPPAVKAFVEMIQE
ncbi:MAG TPA: HD domain-containing phosphohydrolase [Anaerolineales bacterium]|nr:HD domain-containing phosphohydrolase [Anaerolineales bacterium]